MYPRYEHYQDSGVAWLGDVPSHWEVKRLKFLITELRVGPFGSAIKISDYAESENLLYNQRTVLDNNFFENVISITDEKYVELCSFQVYAGDFLITTRGTIGKVAIVPKNASKGIIHPCLIRFRIDESRIFPRLLKIIFNETAFFQDQLKLKSNATTIDVIYSNSLKELILLLPPLPEQTAIAAFLDCKLVQIDALISKQETLLAKLAEKRTALITHAVTRGLNPAAPLKPSGVAWLGEVPQHWEVKRLRFVLEVNPVKSELNLPDETTVSFIPMDAVNFDKNLTLTQEKSLDEVYKGYTFFRDNDVLLAKITPCFENGKSAIAQNLTNGIGFGTTELHVLRANGQFNNHFLYYLLKTDLFMKLGESQMYGAGGQKRISEEFIKNFSLGIPPLAEQTAIAHYLDTQTAQIDALSNKIRQTIARLQEYRRTLITQAVTGKIKVIGEHR